MEIIRDWHEPLDWRALAKGHLNAGFNRYWVWGYQSAYYDGCHYALHLGPISVGLSY
jgi:hypothetical protein